MSGTIARRELPPQVGALLREARLRAGLGLRETARLAGISHNHLVALEGATRCPSTAVAVTLAEVLDLPLGQRQLLLRCAAPDTGRSDPRRAATRAGSC